MVVFAVFGFGYWGPIIVRNIIQTGNDVKYIVDLSAERRKEAKKKYPQCKVESSTDFPLKDPEVEAVVVALPTFLHYEMAKKSLLAGKNVLVEKPLTSNSAQARELIEISKKENLVLMVDHTYLYSPSIQKIKEVFRENDENIECFDSTRMNLGKYQRDINVIWDLAPHDLAILDFLIGEKPNCVKAIASSHVKEDLEDVAHIFVNYSTGKKAHISVSWFSPVKIRNIVISGKETMTYFNDLNPDDKLTIFKPKFIEKNGIVECGIDESVTVGLDKTETVSLMLMDFVSSVEKRTPPVSNSHIGLNVVLLLEKLQESVSKGGVWVKI